MTSTRDPIEQLREIFDGVSSSALATKQWQTTLDAAMTRADDRQRARRAIEEAVSCEPLPWKILTASAMAAVVALAAVIVPSLQPRESLSNRVAERPSEVVAQQLAILTKPAMDADLPSGRTMYVHIPTPPRELSESWDQITSILWAIVTSSDSTTTS